MNGVLTYLALARQHESDELARLARTCELVLITNELVHRLQQERGASSMFLASRGARFGALRQDRIAASNEARASVEDWLAQDDCQRALSGGVRLYTRIAQALHALSGLGALRAQVDQQACSLMEATEQFNHLVSALMALVFEAADVAVDPGISRLLIGLFQLMQGKEYAGQERAAGATAFAAGRITPEQVQKIEYLIEMQEQSLQHFAALADSFRAEWQALQSLLPLPELEKMRRKLLGAAQQSLDRADTDEWFEICTRRMDGFHQVENHVAEILREICQNKVCELRQELAQQAPHFSMLGETGPLPPLAVFKAGGLPEGEVASPHLMQVMLEQLQAQSTRLQSVTEELTTVRAALEERKVIERAKGILMAHQGLSEEGAYRLLRRNAMNQKKRLADVAQAVLSLAEILPTGN